jgi:hypothetical protein
MAETAEAEMVSLRAVGSFHENADMTGRLLQAGDTFSTYRSRAVELRANGLVAYVDEDEEKKASADDPPPSEDNGVRVITTRSLRSRK